MVHRVSHALWRGRDRLDGFARHRPASLALLVFAGVIGVVTLLLLTPAATAGPDRVGVVDALFTATSAVSVTGLTVVDTGTYWSPFGQTVILLAMQAGGLGVMTLASLIGIAVSRRLGLTQRVLTATETRTARLGEVGSLLRVVVLTSAAVQAVVVLALLPRFLALGRSVGEATWHAVFYAVSAFNNAGFVPTSEGLVPHTGDALVEVPIGVGVFIGSLGFPVILNVVRTWRRPRHWSLHAKLTVSGSVGLVLVGTLAIGILEWGRSATLGTMGWGERLLAAVFASVNTRSGGFSTVDVADMSGATWLVTDALMFVGGGSASTAGGIKVSTLMVMLLAILVEARGDRDTEAFGRRIQRDVLRLAVAVAMVSATVILVATVALIQLTDLPLEVALFETISAFATCGLSTGITAELPDSARLLLTVLMFVGRTGPMTLAGALALRDRRRVIRLPHERPLIG